MPMNATSLAQSLAVLIFVAMWVAILVAGTIVVLAVRRWSFAAQQQAKAFERIAAAMERGVDPRSVGSSRSDAG